MMSLRAVNAGRGYEYLLRSVATNDADSSSAPSLSSYYQAKGTPPGRWLGRGLEGLDSSSIGVGTEISELHMAALFGEGIHPETDGLMAQGASLKECFLGRPFPNFAANDPVLIAIRNAEQAFRRREQRLPTEEERSELVQEVASPIFEQMHGCPPTSGKELIAWVNNRKDQVRQAVAGYDFTFSPAKSISALWALSDEETATSIAACHHRAVAQAMAWAEEEFIRTRQGAGGRRQVKTKGLLAAEFTHFDTRAGDPDLHSHVLISNKVQDEDGKWKALDGRTIFRFHQAMSWRYDVLVRDELSRSLGIDFQARPRGKGKQPVWEVAGIGDDLVDFFSKRRAGAQPVFEAKKQAYVQRTGASPSKGMLRQFWQEAILETRDAKRPAQSLSTLREQWLDEVKASPKGHDFLAQVRNIETKRGIQRAGFVEDSDSAGCAHEAIELVTSRRNVFRRSHLITATATVLARYHFPTVEEFETAEEAVIKRALEDYALSLNQSEQLELPAQLVDDNGMGIDRPIDSDLFTTASVVSAEQSVLDAANEPTPVAISDHVVELVFNEHKLSEGWELNAGQKALARHFLTSGMLVSCGIGPAGTGKTASMKVVVEAMRKAGRSVVGLAPSAAAAEVLAEDIGAPAHTIDSLTFIWSGKHPTLPGNDVSALPVDISAGDILLVDEAGMATTSSMAALVDIAKATGAVVRFVGDHRQLGAVENGGLFGALARLSDSVELSEVMRFGDDAEQADASLKLRDGVDEGLEFYRQRGWIHGGVREHLLVQAADDYLMDLDAGRRALVVAATNKDVEDLNAYIRAQLIERGVVDEAVTAVVAASRAGVGDTVMARANARFLAHRDGADGRVINGDLFTVVGISQGGDLRVARGDGSTQTLPAAYVREHVHLGYASTVHKAQGATVDVARAVIDSTTDRNGLYVALSRGKFSNHAYVVEELAFDFEAEDAHYHYQGEQKAPQAMDVLRAVLARDGDEKSAVETLHDEMLAATSPERVEGLWLYGRDLLVDEVVASEVDGWLERLEATQRAMLAASPDGDEPIRNAWKALMRAGVDPAEVMESALSDLDGAADLGRLIAFRLRSNLPDVERAGLPAFRDYFDQELYSWLVEHSPAAALREGLELEDGKSYEGLDLSSMDFQGLCLDGASFRHCSFNGSDLSKADLNKVRFRDCDFSGTSLNDASLQSCHFQACDFNGAEFTRAEFGSPTTRTAQTMMVGCYAAVLKMRDAIVHALHMMSMKVGVWDLTGADVRRCRLQRSEVGSIVGSTAVDLTDADSMEVRNEESAHRQAASAVSPAEMLEPIHDEMEL